MLIEPNVLTFVFTKSEADFDDNDSDGSTFTRHHRHMLSEPVNHAPFHHNARMHLRKILAQKSKHKQKSKHGSKHHHKRNGHSTHSTKYLEVPQQPRKPPRNVSFADQVELGKLGETGQADEVNKNGKDYNMKHSDVIFYVGTSPDESDSRMRTENQRDADVPRTPPDSPDPIVVVTPTAAETTLPWKRPSDTPPVSASRNLSSTMVDTIAVSEVPQWIGVEKSDKKETKVQESGQGDGDMQINGDPCLDDPETDPDVTGSVPLKKKTPPNVVTNDKGNKGKKNNFKNAVVDIIITSASPVFNSTLSDKEDTSKHKEVPKEEIDPGDCVDNAVQETTSDYCQNIMQNNSSSPADYDPLRTPAESQPVTAVEEDSMSQEEDISPIPPPWRNNDSPVEHDFHKDIPAEPEAVMFTVGSHAELDDVQSVENNHDSEVPTLPPPWKSDIAPERSPSKHVIHNSSSVTPTWRQFSNDSSAALRSPSVAATLDSMMPHPSCHSFRISEAESHHSLHMHMHQLIDPLHLPHNNSHCDLETIQDLDSLDLPHCDSKERIVHWILYSDADPELPVNDLDFEQELDRLKQLEKEREAAIAAGHSYEVRSTCSLEKLPTVHEASPADLEQAMNENLPMGTTAKTVNVTEKIHRINSSKRNSPPADVQVINFKEPVVSQTDESSYL